jgi:acyl dehydratase
MTEPEDLVAPYRHLIGMERVYTASEEVGRASIRKFALALADHNPHDINGEIARQSKYGDVIAPPTFVCETWQYYGGQPDEQGGFTDGLNMPSGQAIRASNDYIFHRSVRPDDIITASWKIRDIYASQHGDIVAGPALAIVVLLRK